MITFAMTIDSLNGHDFALLYTSFHTYIFRTFHSRPNILYKSKGNHTQITDVYKVSLLDNYNQRESDVYGLVTFFIYVDYKEPDV